MHLSATLTNWMRRVYFNHAFFWPGSNCFLSIKKMVSHRLHWLAPYSVVLWYVKTLCGLTIHNFMPHWLKKKKSALINQNLTYVWLCLEFSEEDFIFFFMTSKFALCARLRKIEITFIITSVFFVVGENSHPQSNKAISLRSHERIKPLIPVSLASASIIHSIRSRSVPWWCHQHRSGMLRFVRRLEFARSDATHYDFVKERGN